MRKHDFTYINRLFSKGKERDVSHAAGVGKMSSFFFSSPLFSPVSVQVNLLNGFSAVAVTLCPVARCLWARGGRCGENFISALSTLIKESAIGVVWEGDE